MSKDINEENKKDLNDFDISKKIHCKGASIHGINTIALMVRMELYVDEFRWKSADKNT